MPPFRHQPSTRTAARLGASLTASAAIALGACADAGPAAPAVEPRTLVVAPAVLAAVEDAAERAVPALADSMTRANVGASLAELRAALENGQAERSRRAVARLEALLDAPAVADGADGVAVADAADASAVLVTAALVRQQLDPAGPAR